MTALAVPYAEFGAAAHPGLFGGNVLAPRASMTGEGSYAEAIDALGVTTLRYPGGSLTETMFDLRNPDSAIAFDADTGQTEDFIPLSEFLGFAEASGHPVTIVIPTRDQLSDTQLDANGDRLPAIDRAVLEGFVRDVVSGRYGEPQIAGFEIGNEYWGSGEMNAAEYGRLAADMSQIIDRQLAALAADHPAAAEIDILVQVGTNFGSSDLERDYAGWSDTEAIEDVNASYGLALDEGVIFPAGGVDWTEVNNAILLSHFDAEALESVDGVVAHVYSRAPEVPHSRWFQMEQIEELWQARDPEIDIHVTEWNQKSNSEAFDEERDYGLFQAQEMLEQIEEFMRMDVAAAQVWPLIQNTPSALALGRDYDTSTAPGEMFALLSENLPGMRMLDFSPGPGRDTEFETPQMDVHAFADGEDLLFYFTSNLRDGVVQSEVDISNLVDGFAAMDITVLGVAQGHAPGNTESPPMLDFPDPEDLHVDGMIETVLAPGEIMQVRLTDVRPTQDFAEVFAATASPAEEMTEGVAETGSDPAGEDLMAALGATSAAPAAAPADADDDEDETGLQGAFGDAGIGLAALGLLPLLLLLA